MDEGIWLGRAARLPFYAAVLPEELSSASVQ